MFGHDAGNFCRLIKIAVLEARAHPGPCLINFKVEQEDSVYPMVPAGARLDQMIRRPLQEPAERDK